MKDEKNLFSFKLATSEEGLKTIYSLKSNKRLLSYTIPVKILKKFSGSFLTCLTEVINHSIPYLTGVVNRSIASHIFLC